MSWLDEYEAKLKVATPGPWAWSFQLEHWAFGIGFFKTGFVVMLGPLLIRFGNGGRRP